MVNTQEFKFALILNEMTAEQLAEEIGISAQSLSYKMNNKREFTSSEIMGIANALNLTTDQRDRIFFNEKVECDSTV